MLVPEGNTKKYIKVITGIYMIFVILSPILLKINNNNLEQEINKALEVSASNFDEEEELEKSFKILNAISENVKTKEEKNVREVQE